MMEKLKGEEYVRLTIKSRGQLQQACTESLVYTA